MLTNMNHGHHPVAIANYFIDLSTPIEGLTLMQLLKLSYIAHGFKLGITDGEILSNEYAEAWKFGPVFPSVYHEFKHIYPEKIKNKTENQEQFNSLEEDIIRFVYETYGSLDGWRLSVLTHKDGSPWSQTWESNLNPKIIQNTLIKKYFKEEILDRAR